MISKFLEFLKNKKCLYCGIQCNTDYKNGYVYHNCTNCLDHYLIYCGDNNKLEYFELTCFKYLINYKFINHNYVIYSNESGMLIDIIPYFEMNFSDKLSIFNKINTYLLYL